MAPTLTSTTEYGIMRPVLWITSAGSGTSQKTVNPREQEERDRKFRQFLSTIEARRISRPKAVK